jgi:DNA-binding response OmpR family regulator
MSKILIIDDDEELCELVSEYLSVEGFTTEAVHDGESGLQKALTNDYELAILDVMLPRKNGFDVLRELRKSSKLPVLMLTAKGDDMERIVGLEIGADDYLPKPFNPRELVARLRAVLRRVGDQDEKKATAAESFTVDDIEVSLTGRTAKIDGREDRRRGIEFNGGRIRPARGAARTSRKDRQKRRSKPARARPKAFAVRPQSRHARQ